MRIRTFWPWCRTSLVVLALVSLPLPALAQGRPQAPQVTRVEVESVARRSLPGSFTFVGTIHPARRAVLGSAVDGRLVEIVEDGAFVRKGAPVARLRTGTINIEIQGAQAELKLRQNELRELEAGSREEEKQMARARLESSKAVYDYAKSRYERNRQLWERGQATSKEEVEQALSAFLAAEKAQAAAQAEYDLTLNGPREEKIAQAQDRVRMQEETYNHLRDRRNKYWVRSYFNGYVVRQYAEVGAWIKQGDPLVEVIELDHVEVLVNVPETHIDKVRLGMDAQVRVDAISAKESFTGKVISINPQADLRSRTFEVKVLLKNEEVETAAAGNEGPAAGATGSEASIAPAAAEKPASGEVEPSELVDTPEDLRVGEGERKIHRLKSGMMTHVTMRLGERKDSLLVPKDALVLGGSTVDGTPSYSVFLAEPTPDNSGHMAKLVPVAVGMFDGNWVEVVPLVPGDLDAGKHVITLGNERLRPGQPVGFMPKK